MSRKNEPTIRVSGCSSEHCSPESRPSYRGFQSFLKWFKKNEQHRSPPQNTSNLSSAHQNGYHCAGPPNIYDSSETIGPTSSPVSTPSSSCESIYSTATTGFAFIPPNQYKPYGDACQPEKLIAVGPVTDTYRERIRDHQNAKELNKHLELTLRKKYNIFDTDTLNSIDRSTFDDTRNNPSSFYTNLSLPQQSLVEPIDKLAQRDITSTSTGTFGKRRRSHRRTVSDSSKDKRAGSYLHVKGKRKAPPPPPPPPLETKSMSLNTDGPTLSPVTTLGRKKRRAPPPPIQMDRTLMDDVPKVLSDGLFDDAEIQAIIGGSATGYTPIFNTANKIGTQKEMDVPQENSSVPSTDTLKLERGILRSNRESTTVSPTLPSSQSPFLEISKASSPASVSPISPRPWYKRSSVTNKDNSIPFKREITLKTMEKRKIKNENNNNNPQLPVVAFSRNSSLFDGFFSRVKHHDRHDENEKRRSGINMPNISELDREAAEIISKEQAIARNLHEESKKYDLGSPPAYEDDDAIAESQRISTKDLINRFEETNLVKFTVNNAFIDKTDRDRYFGEQIPSLAVTTTVAKTTTSPTTQREIGKNRLAPLLQTTSTTESSLLSSSSSASSSSSSMSMAQSIFSDLKETLNTTTTMTTTPSVLFNSDSKEKITATHNESMTTTGMTPQKESNLKPDAHIAALSEKKTTTWICSYCTLENYNWRVICEVCERIKPYDKQGESSVANKLSATAAVVNETDATDETKRLRYLKNTSPNKSTGKIVKTDHTSAEKVMKFLCNKSNVSSTLSKSASETSVNFSKKASAASVGKSMASPKLTSKQRQSDVIRSTGGNERTHEKALTEQRKPALIDSSAVITTQTSVYVAPLPAKHVDNFHGTSVADQPSIDVLRAVRVAKFTDTKSTGLQDVNEVQPAIRRQDLIEKPLLNDHNSLEREKQRLREMIRAMNAKALLEKYPVTKKEESGTAEQATAEAPQLQAAVVTNDDATRLGAIKKMFNRKSERDDSVIAENTNCVTSKIEQDKQIYKEPYSKVSVEAQTPVVRRPELLQLPSPIFEMNENDVSPAVVPLQSLESIVDKEIDNIYAQLKMDIPSKDETSLTEISQQLNSTKGLEDFKSTLKSSSKHMSNTNTLALNRILKNLEVAICDGNHELAATLAMDLAKMKVSLCVTKIRETQSVEPTENQSIESETKTIMVDMFIDENNTHKGPISLKLSPAISVYDLKQRIANDFDVPIEKQRWILNNKLASDDTQQLANFGIKDKSIVYLYVVSMDKEIRKENTTTFSDTKLSNIIIDPMIDKSANSTRAYNDNDGAKALPLLLDDPYGTLKIGWTCPLCTLINSPNRPGCVACSETRPAAYVIPPEYKVSANTFDNGEQLQKIIVDDENNKAPQLEVKNDLNRTTANRKSAEIFNIIVKEEMPKQPDESFQNVKSSTPPTTGTPSALSTDDRKPKVIAVTSKTALHTSIVMTAITASPNITKNKYRGVDNYNPQLNNKQDTKLVVPYKSPLVKPMRTTTRISQPLDVKPYIGRAVKYIEKKDAPKSKIITTAKTDVSPNSVHYTELLSLDKNSIVANAESFECPICLEICNPGEGIVLRECIHTFCRECIVNTVKYSEEAEVKCPYMDAEYSCDCVIQEREIRSLLTKEAYDQHLAVSLSLAEHRTENAFHCKTPSCRGWCIYEDNVNQFKCPICMITNCLTCRVIHDGLNCKQYQDRMGSGSDSSLEARRTGDMLAEMINNGEAMKCPICQVILMKKWGCDWLKCSMCKTEICWVTRGIRWGPEGKGDTSGGCKCGVNGVKCHPKCNYCH